MAVYFDNRVNVDSENITDVKWHDSLPLLATATCDNGQGCISFFKDEVSYGQDENYIQILCLQLK